MNLPLSNTRPNDGGRNNNNRKKKKRKFNFALRRHKHKSTAVEALENNVMEIENFVKLDQKPWNSPGGGNDNSTSSSDEQEDAGENTASREWGNKLRQYTSKRDCRRSTVTVERKKHVETVMRESLWKFAREEIARRDPRSQILQFFNDVAQEGAQHVEQDGKIDASKHLHPLLQDTFSLASVFTVWRPTSMDAIRKMICGEAVGKGLDIKGKSAKRGLLSGFVPFLQITENKHKNLIRNLTHEGRVRLFYMGEKEGAIAREVAVQILRKVYEEMKQQMVQNSDAYNRLEMSDPYVRYIHDYEPTRYGLDIPVRLFWEAFIQRQDISRKKGSHYDTGRPSMPTFQDMNIATLNYPPKEGQPRPVILQNAAFVNRESSPMNPFELILAYEEIGRVLPVVSDFDCFLVGTRRVTYHTPLGSEESKVLGWCIDECEKILEKNQASSGSNNTNWTDLWCDTIKDAAQKGFTPKVPRFGFGDPKSYSIMENAVGRLNVSGAVRHGAECFNYFFPQDLDDKFLVIGPDRIPGKIPWKYVDENGLLEFLNDKIDYGYTFPLNPKWVLCDAGRWRDLYHKLMVNDTENTIDSMNVWYPRKGGVREKMRRIMQLYPNGFVREPLLKTDAASGLTIDPDEIRCSVHSEARHKFYRSFSKSESDINKSSSSDDDSEDNKTNNDSGDPKNNKENQEFEIPVHELVDLWHEKVPLQIQEIVQYVLLFLLVFGVYYSCSNSVIFRSDMDIVGMSTIGTAPTLTPAANSFALASSSRGGCTCDCATEWHVTTSVWMFVMDGPPRFWQELFTNS